MLVFFMVVLMCSFNNSYAESLDNQFYLREQGIFVDLQHNKY